MGRTKYCKKVALKHSSKDCPRLVVNASICTIMKLKYLSRIIAGVDHDNVSQRVLSSLVDDVESFNIVRECKATLLVTEPEVRGTAIKEMRKSIKGIDLALLVDSTQAAYDYSDLYNMVGWRKFWDNAIDHGSSCIISLKNLVRIITHPTHASSICFMHQASVRSVM